MISIQRTFVAAVAGLVMAANAIAPAIAKPLKPYQPGTGIYKPGPGKKFAQPMPKPIPLPANKHGHKHHGRNVAIGIAAATAAAIAASSGSGRCHRWAVQCEDGSRRACRKYEANCE